MHRLARVAALLTVVAAGLVVATPALAVPSHDNTVYAFGAATFQGSTQGKTLVKPIIAMAATADGGGYWLVAEDGGVFTFGNARFYGSLSGWPLVQPVVGITATTTGHGYWLVTADGAVAPFGDAHNYGSMQGRHLNAPIKSIVPGPGSNGYFLYAADGGVFTFGTARFRGSMGGRPLNAPVVGMASTPSGNGYWLVAADGGVFTFGDAKFRGSMGGRHINKPVVGMARDGSGLGYWLGAEDGGVFRFGDAQFKGSAVGLVPNDKHIAGIVGMPAGDGYRMFALDNVADVPLVGPGASGPGVAYLQTRLLAQGYWIPGVNAVFDDLTQQAVWAFQKANGLPRTGTVDGPTQNAFRSAKRPQPRSTNGYLFEVDKTRQIMMIANNGVAQWTFNISSGSDIPYSENGTSGSAHTPEGVFTVIRQVDGSDASPLGHLWRPKSFTWHGHAIHGYTSVPPYPASHGCVRVSNTAMNWIWDTNALPIGTTVWVYV